MKKVIIACGGTGGHLSPGIALAEKLREKGHTCRLLISRKSIDAKMIGKYRDSDFVRSPGSPLSFHPVGFICFLFNQVRSFHFSFRLLGEFRPDMVVGFGGFQSAGMIIAAYLRRTPIVLHESNRVPGRATRVLQGLAKRVYLPGGVSLSRMNPERIRYCGTPVRREIRKKGQVESRRNLGLKTEGRWLMVLGGSQGALSLNEWVRSHCAGLAERGIHIFCVTGPNKGEEEVLSFRSSDNREIDTHLVAFSDRIPEILSAADLVISRAGAGTISELIRCRTPSILIPYPHAADNHQQENARYMERVEGAVVLEEEHLSQLEGVVLELLFDDVLLRRLRTQLEAMDRDDAGQLIADDMEQLWAAQTKKGLFPFEKKLFREHG